VRELGRLLEAGVSAGVFPGGVAVVRRAQKAVSSVAVGNAEVVPEHRAVQLDTLFDLASLTKVLCTVPVVLRLCAEGLVDLDAPLRRWLPELQEAPCGRVTVRQALAHTGGLPAWRPLYLEARGLDAVVQAVAKVPLEAEPGHRVVYSDLGVLLVGAAVERATGRRMDALFEEHVARPLGLGQSQFCPPPAWHRRCAATERGNRYERDLAGEAGAGFPWREGVIVGEVHDGNAYYALGGVAPHAGLFSTAEEVARVAEAWAGPAAWLPEGYRLEAVRDQRGAAAGPPRGLGWVLHHPEAFFAALGPRSFGHTGFTGTSVAVDPERALVVVLLTNRVHPQVREGVADFRRAFHEAVARFA
jgi:CubicO group peptidase (beta-lactamase class C family)